MSPLSDSPDVYKRQAQQQPDSLVVIFSPQFVIHHIDVEIQLPCILRFEWSSFQSVSYTHLAYICLPNNVCYTLAIFVKDFKGNESQASQYVAHISEVDVYKRQACPGEIGVAIIINNTDTVKVNDKSVYPDVYKRQV